ncbi:hypothetical protein CDAR_104751 [Caerostris darwini]|uniref:Uncharacterized protein n=1 Tax=Caerostris darwini TaxID=1538125 RepID=A0AAV4W2X3_9ARAC|nr:hypothetical protein CDAR_104751 [Caerostris darwini]
MESTGRTFKSKSFDMTYSSNLQDATGVEIDFLHNTNRKSRMRQEWRGIFCVAQTRKEGGWSKSGDEWIFYMTSTGKGGRIFCIATTGKERAMKLTQLISTGRTFSSLDMRMRQEWRGDLLYDTNRKKRRYGAMKLTLTGSFDMKYCSNSCKITLLLQDTSGREGIFYMTPTSKEREENAAKYIQILPYGITSKREKVKGRITDFCKITSAVNSISNSAENNNNNKKEKPLPIPQFFETSLNNNNNNNKKKPFKDIFIEPQIPLDGSDRKDFSLHDSKSKQTPNTMRKTVFLPEMAGKTELKRFESHSYTQTSEF